MNRAPSWGITTITPAAPVPAGAWCTLRFRFRCGQPIDETGGLAKEIQVCRLPDRLRQHDFDCALPIGKLQRGDNPIHVRVTQEDGHLSWSSPIYLVK
ncbi:MAG: hypothetical protein PCFJNLEI_01655 [Verrucomicrobiae bacterium]|nr:hypothetical protein [Verrucomicrobiae bacterium]